MNAVVTRRWLRVASVAAISIVLTEPLRAQHVRDTPVKNAGRTTLDVGMWTLWHDREATLTPAGANRDLVLLTCEHCAPVSVGPESKIRAVGKVVSFTIGGKTEHAERLWLTGPVALAAHGETQTLQHAVTISARDGVLVIAVKLPVETYVERVLASESGPADSEESLKALAIVIRTFALHERHGHADFDLCDSTHCQLLHWSSSAAREPAAHAAVLASAGETLWFHGKRALGYFGKDCGGVTASPAEIWPGAKALLYLPSRPDPYCAGRGGNTWASELTRAELTTALVARGIAQPGWTSLMVARRGESGRVVALKLDGAEIGAEEFRLAVGETVGWNRIPSTLFEVTRQGDRFYFHGKGWGNGVGMCQKGAAEMAAQKHTAGEILAQYFPGADAADEATGQSWKQFAGEGFTLESLSGKDAEFLPLLARARFQAAQVSGINATPPIVVRSFASTTAFREGTLAPGWVAAFTEGQWIGAQPLVTLAARRLLDSTMRHEFVHALVEYEAGANASLWLREGLAEAWSEDGTRTAITVPTMKLDAVDAALAHAANEKQSQAAHRAARWYATHALDRYGRTEVLSWLRSSVPASALATLDQR
jgi:stage II sporulation protein D